MSKGINNLSLSAVYPQAVPLDWWPLTRDCFIYGSIVIGLTVVVSDNMIFWWEAMIFVLCYGVFLTGAA